MQAFRTSHVLFLLAAQDRHAQKFVDNVSLLAERWNGQIEVVGLAKNRFFIKSGLLLP